MKRHGDLILNEGDFGTFYTEGKSTKFYLRVRSFIDIQTGELLTDDAGQPQRRQQKALLATQSDKYTSVKSPEVVALAGQLRRRIIAFEEAAVNGQTVKGDGSVSQTPAPGKPNGKMTIAKFFDTVFIPAMKGLRDSGKLANITFETYQNYWDLFLSKHFLPTLTFQNYFAWQGQAWLEGLRKDDGSLYGENTVRKIRSVATAIFEEARERGLLDENVPPKHNVWKDIKQAKLPSVPTEQGVAYTEAEVETLVRNLDAELGSDKHGREARDTNIRNAQIALLLGFFAGLRPSETEALGWSNVDVLKGTIKVCESTVNGVKAKRTKTGETRVVTYLEPLVPVLREWHKRQGSPKSGLVIHKNSEPVSLKHLSDEVVKPAAEKAGLGDRWQGYYGARRGCGTLLVQTGSSCEQGGKFLGNTPEVFRAHYWIDKGEASAAAADNYRQHKLAKAKASEVGQGLTEQRKLQGELAALGLGDGGAE
jgi:integrase